MICQSNRLSELVPADVIVANVSGETGEDLFQARGPHELAHLPDANVANRSARGGIEFQHGSSPSASLSGFRTACRSTARHLRAAGVGPPSPRAPRRRH